MGKHIRNFFNGMGQVLVISPCIEYEIPHRGDFSRDQEALRGDFRRVAKVLTSTVEKNEDYRTLIEA